MQTVEADLPICAKAIQNNHGLTYCSAKNAPSNTFKFSLKLLAVINFALLAACGSGGSSTEAPAAGDVTDTVTESAMLSGNEPVVITGNDATDPVSQPVTDTGTDANAPTDSNQSQQNPTVTEDPTTDEVDVNDTNNATEATGGDNQNAEEPAEPDNANTVDAPVAADNNPVELSPIALFLEEIRLAAGDRVIEINQRFAGGENISPEENACLGTFEPGLGLQATALDCTDADSGLLIYESDLILQQVELLDTDACQLSLSISALDNCLLQQASMLLPVIWVPIENPAPSQIGTIRPLQDADIQYNTNNDGILQVSGRSNVFPPLFCEIDITTNALLTTDRTLGNCRSQINELSTRLFEFRQSR